MPSTTTTALTVMGRFRAPSILVSTGSYVSVKVGEEIIQKTGDDDQVEDGDPDSMILCEKGSTYGPLREPTRSIQYPGSRVERRRRGLNGYASTSRTRLYAGKLSRFAMITSHFSQ